ncbi:hypothetical protein ACFQ1Q_13310 [Winogradskyella litorisediminis]|uniref:Lipocalin-like domain-containing protein n=1 Tax=Winogradskyella litorisediminis TaxID=1156618 RepID=A0ABW3NA73_9FLAO
MRSLYLIIVAVFFHSFLFSQKDNTLFGQWQLVSWSVDLPMDLNNDGQFSTNLIEETNCKNNEVLTISTNGILKSNKTFNPTVNISKTATGYEISETCNEGSIGFSNQFTLDDNKLYLDIGGNYKLVDGNLIRVFEGAVNVFNSDYSKVSETKNLTLVYKKK